MTMCVKKRPLGALNKKYIFHVSLKTVSPLRIASGQTDYITDILVLKNKKGKAFIPATSIAGVLRSEIRKIYGEKIAGMIFGYIEKNDNGAQSVLSVDDVIFDKSDVISRDGVHIDEFSGTGVSKEKYNFEAVEKGAEGILTMEMTVREGHETEWRQMLKSEIINGQGIADIFRHSQYEKNSDIFSEVAASLAEMLAAGIRIGSLTAKGMGLIKSKEPVNVYLFDFVKNLKSLESNSGIGDADVWLKYVENRSLPEPSYVADGQYEEGIQLESNSFSVKARFAIKSSLLVRDVSRIYEYASSGNTGTIAGVPMKSGQDYVIPGTGIKGALRGKAYKILMALPCITNENIKNFLDRLMGWANKGKNNDNAEEGKKSRLIVNEIYFSCDSHKDIHEMKQTRNRIDRFTGATIKSALFTEFAVWQKNKETPTLEMNLRIDDATHAEAGLMLLLLRELWNGNLPLGGGKSIGRGVLQGIVADIYYEKQHFRLEQRLPLKNNLGQIKITGTNQDQNELDNESICSLLQGYVTDLANEMANGQVNK